MLLSLGERRLISPVTRPHHGLVALPLMLAMLCSLLVVSTPAAQQPGFPVSGSSPDGSPASLDLTADQVEFDRTTETFIATGAVVITQGHMRLTSDHARLHKLSGRLQANGRVHLRDPVTDIWAEELAINVNTESGVITRGKIHLRETNTWIRGRLLQRFSETHLRAKDGSFTNCDADDGQIPDWSFAFEDLDLEQGDSIYAKNVWLQVRNHSILPFPTLRYPMPDGRRTGFLVPSMGWDSKFGVKYRQGFFWALTPSQDLLLTPYILSKRGQGADIAYRYILNQHSRGDWQVNTLNDTDEDQVRALVTGAHVQQVTDTLGLQMKVNYASDREVYQDLSSSGAFRALPGQESNLTMTQLLPGGSAYLKAQYIQPLDVGGKSTFQRLPEVGHYFEQPALFGLPVSVGMESNFVHFFREEGFDVSRAYLMPRIATQGLHVGHVIGLRPQFKLLEAIYSHGRESTQTGVRHRGTYWVGVEANSSLSRRFSLGNNRVLRHTVQPSVVFEYVHQSKQSDLVQIDAIDTLRKKNLLTYSVSSRLLESGREGPSTTWLDVLFAQSYHLGDSPPPGASIFSDLYGRTTITLPPEWSRGLMSRTALTFDGFFDPSKSEFSQWNSDITVQVQKEAYMQLGHRYTRSGLIPQRGDIWNPFSFNDVLVQQNEINFLTAAGGFKTPFGWTLGTKVYQDFSTGQTAEWDVVGLYENACKCWSLGLYYIRLGASDTLPERDQFSFALTLRGVGATPGLGAQLIQTILGPLLTDEP